MTVSRVWFSLISSLSVNARERKKMHSGVRPPPLLQQVLQSTHGKPNAGLWNEAAAGRRSGKGERRDRRAQKWQSGPGHDARPRRQPRGDRSPAQDELRRLLRFLSRDIATPYTACSVAIGFC